MTTPQFQWCSSPQTFPEKAWLERFAQIIESQGLPGYFAKWSGQLLWQRQWRALSDVEGFLNPARYEPSSPFALGMEMDAAIARLITAQENREKVAIWGDFDADGLTATAVLWEGLGQFFEPHQQLRYYVPNRFTESHGLSQRGLDSLGTWGTTLIVTCDTGSTAHTELVYAQELGIDVIVTDHHTLPETRPPVVALINPRQLPAGHPLADLSGVAVAYKLVEALYDQLPGVAQQPLETLLDLVAIGLIADLVMLQGDCRYLTQIGLKILEQQAKQGTRPGVTKLLELCKRSGDRPSDVAFGIGPRINAISRIHGDARFGVELLTSRDLAQATQLALEAELANTRRKELQASVMQQAIAQLSEFDLSTTQVIILSDPQWSPGVLGLVASQIAQQYGRPTILFQTETTAQPGGPPLARGSARSVKQIDLYDLVKAQASLLTSFGGHPYAAGLTLPVENLPLFAEGVNRALRSQLSAADLSQAPVLNIDLTVTVADLGKDLFRALRLLEPYGMGNPVPRLLLKNVRVEAVRDYSLRDQRRGKQRYFKVEFDLRDASSETPFPGHWWGHRRDELPEGNYDLVVELDVNTFKRRYEARLVDLRSVETLASSVVPSNTGRIVDHRHASPVATEPPAIAVCPADWSDLSTAMLENTPLVLAYPPPQALYPTALWQQWLGIAKYLARTGDTRSLQAIREKLELSDRTLAVGLQCWRQLGYGVSLEDDQLRLDKPRQIVEFEPYEQIAQEFILAVQEELFRRQYFYQVSPETVQQVLGAR